MILFMPRPSHVRHAVAALLSASDRHGWSIDEVDQALRERGVKADFSSIFRALNHLERQGLLDRVDFMDGKARYEVHQEHHEHVRCTSCHEVAPIPCCILTEAQSALAASTGYLVSGHQVLFEGLCPTCSAQER
jgi:Fe2+ or Zn2+ uptake regulation protein